MEERLNVLSIDWDYFINASMSERLNLFPDGGNEKLSEVIGNAIWASRYFNNKLSSIKVDKDAVAVLKDTLSMIECDLQKMMVVDSHRYAYQFVKDSMKELGYDSVNLLNVDFHHDVYGVSEEVDCGNWLRILMKELDGTDSKFTWLKRSDSDTADADGYKNLEQTDDVNILSEYQWDILFICRSAMWSPPHLDEAFVDCFKFIFDDGFIPIQYQEGITDTRMTEVSSIYEKDLKVLKEA